MRFASQGRIKLNLSGETSVSRSLSHAHLRFPLCIVRRESGNAFRNRVIGCALSVLIVSTCAFFPQRARGNVLARGCTSTLLNWRNKQSNVNSYRRWIDPRFTQVERNLIEEALRIAVRRIQQKRNWDEIQERYSYAWVTTNSLSQSGLCSEADVRRNLLFHQLYWLSLPNGENDTSPAFPDIYIHRGYEERAPGYRGWLARARYDTVRIYWDGDSWRSTGDSKFVMTLNNYFVAGPGVYSSAEGWAGTIAHEMLHNLGHRHPDIDDPNYEKYQINVVDEVIQNDGYSYKGSRPTLLSLHTCAGR